MNKRTWLLMLTALPLMLALAACGLNGPVASPSVVSVPAQSSLAAGTQKVPPSASPETVLPAQVTLDLFLGGKKVHSLGIDAPEQKQIVMDAVHEYVKISLTTSSAIFAIDPESMEDYICIAVKSNSQDALDKYYVFDNDKKHCMQRDKDKCIFISDKVYQPLFDLAMGCYLPHVMTVGSGKNSILAPGFVVRTERKEDGRVTEMERLSPQDVAAHIHYLELDPERHTITPFTPCVYGKKVYGKYTLYDEKFGKVSFFYPSGLEPQTYLFHDAGPGKYVVELEITSEEGDLQIQRQYFFGVILH